MNSADNGFARSFGAPYQAAAPAISSDRIAAVATVLGVSFELAVDGVRLDGVLYPTLVEAGVWLGQVKAAVADQIALEAAEHEAYTALRAARVATAKPPPRHPWEVFDQVVGLN